MTTTTTFTGLSAPAEDTMEMSSPAIRNLDDDIDIDFGDYTGGVALAEDDEQMQEDGEQTGPPTAIDDRMSDGEPLEQTHVEVEAMQDDAEVQVEQPDDELIDYGDEDFLDHTFTVDEQDQDTGDGGNVADQAGDATVEQADEEIVRPPEDFTPEQPDALAEPAVVESGQAHLHASDDALTFSEAPVDAAVGQEPDAEGNQSSGLHSEDATDAPAGDTAETGQGVVEAESAQTEPALQAPISISTSVSVSNDAPGTPTDTGLHPTTIRYGDVEWPLFKSKSAPEGLLNDDNLASLSLAELMTHCRQRLALKIGEDVSEDQELALSFEHLACTLVENSRASFETSLNDVLEVYLTLHQNDGVHDIPPLSLNLSLQLKFASSLAMLKQAAASGQGMSQFNFLHRNQEYPDDQDGHPETGQDDTTYGEAFEEQPDEYQEQVDTTHFEDALEQGNEDDWTGEDSAEANEEPQECNNYHHNGNDQAPQEYEHHANAEHQAPGSASKQQEQQLEATHDDPTADIGRSAGDVAGEDVKDEFTSSSTTVSGDVANHNGGEYDYIDWDNDSILTDPPELPADGQDEVSTFITEPDQEIAKGLEGSDVQEGDGPQHVEPPILGSEDFLQEDFEEHANHEAARDDRKAAPSDRKAGQDEAGYENSSGKNAGHEGDGDDEAYTYDEEQDVVPPADDDEPIDFLNGDLYETGPEHQPDGDEDTAEDQPAITDNEANDYLNADDGFQDPEDDDIIFDDDTTEQHAARKISHGNGSSSNTDSPLGKRSFDEHAAAEDVDDDVRDLKKVRSS